MSEHKKRLEAIIAELAKNNVFAVALINNCHDYGHYQNIARRILAKHLAAATDAELLAAREDEETKRQFDCLRIEYNAITRLSKQFDEFKRVYDPECELPQLAEHVHGIIGGLCDHADQAGARVAELERLLREAGSNLHSDTDHALIGRIEAALAQQDMKNIRPPAVDARP